MGYSSVDDFTNELTVNGKKERILFGKSPANGATSAAGRFHELFTATGTPGAGTFSGTAGAATTCNRSTVGALPLGADVTPDTKHLLKMMNITPSTVMAPGILHLVDILGYHPACVVTGTPTTLGAMTLPARDDNGSSNGVGVQVGIFVQSALGATQPALTLTYTDAGGTGSRTGVLTAPAASAPVSTAFANNGSMFLPLPANQTGVRSVQSYTLATGTTGTVAIVYFRIIESLPIIAANTPAITDFVNQIPSFPRVYDNSCLALIAQIGGAMTTAQSISGEILLGWG